MGRRNHQDDGIISDVFNLLFEISKAAPFAGIIISVVIILTGCYFWWINPKAVFGTGILIGMVLIFAGIIITGCGLIYLISGKLNLVNSPGLGRRQRPQESFRTSGSLQTPESFQTIGDLRKMNWKQFERLIADLYRREGFEVEEVGQQAHRERRGDGGVDLILRKDGAEHLLQCKHYYGNKVVQLKEVRDFYGAMADYKTRSEGIFITCGRYTEPALEFSRRNTSLRLIDGEMLIAMLRKSNPMAPVVQYYTPTGQVVADPIKSYIPLCPRCRVPMVRRVANQGPSAGEPFWGCSQFPKCREIIAIAKVGDRS